MTLRELSLFFQLCEDTHISNLAQKLGITQSAISLSIKSLENQLGEQLFDRIGKRLVLNEVGRYFQEKTKEHFIALSDAEHLFQDNKISGNLNVASSKTIGNFVTSQIIFDFLDNNKNVNINKIINNSAYIISGIKNATIDIGFIESACNDSEIIKEEIGNDNMVVVTADKKLKGRTVYIDELRDKKWIIREVGSGTRDVFLDAIGDTAKELQIFMEFTDFEEAKTLLLQNSQTITCLSRVAVQKELEREELFEVHLANLQINRKFYLIYNQEKYQSKLFKAFKEFVKEKCLEKFHI